MARVAARVVEVREAVAKAAATGEAKMAAAATAAVATAEVATEAVRVAGGGGNGGGDGGCGFLGGRLGPLELSVSQFQSVRSLDGQHATFADKFSEGGLKEPSTLKLRPPAAACWKASCSAFRFKMRAAHGVPCTEQAGYRR